ncbi:hypothetical protein DsansV1_C15g0137681 [Dioscorea sansibarensis]
MTNPSHLPAVVPGPTGLFLDVHGGVVGRMKTLHIRCDKFLNKITVENVYGPTHSSFNAQDANFVVGPWVEW